jgi:hypothetical protein
MPDLSGLLVAWAAPIFIGVRATVSWRVDSFNDLASRPIPVAVTRWEPWCSGTSKVNLVG